MAKGEGKKSEKVQSPSSVVGTEPGSMHVYPDWSAMQAYYGPRVAIPQYYNSPVPPNQHRQPYVWGPSQPMVPPYGPPYAALYAHGGVCCHSGVPIGSLPAGAANVERSSEKRMKAFDGLAITVASANDASEDDADAKKSSESVGTDNSTDPSEENNERKVSANGSPQTKKRNASKTMSRSIPVGLSAALAASDVIAQDEKELKRERRKQSNRESARRSRLRKRAETEELGRKVESLTAENVALRSQINELEEKSAELRVENSALVGKLKDGEESGKRGVSTENLLARVDKADRGIGEEVVLYERTVNSGAQLRQLLRPDRRADAVAAR